MAQMLNSGAILRLGTDFAKEPNSTEDSTTT